jgi:hypothetical protein
MKEQTIEQMVKETIAKGILTESRHPRFLAEIGSHLIMVPEDIYTVHREGEYVGSTKLCWGCEDGSRTDWSKDVLRSKITLEGKDLLIVGCREPGDIVTCPDEFEKKVDALKEKGLSGVRTQRYIPSEEVLEILRQRLEKEAYDSRDPGFTAWLKSSDFARELFTSLGKDISLYTERPLSIEESIRLRGSLSRSELQNQISELNDVLALMVGRDIAKFEGEAYITKRLYHPSLAGQGISYAEFMTATTPQREIRVFTEMPAVFERVHPDIGARRDTFICRGIGPAKIHLKETAYDVTKIDLKETTDDMKMPGERVYRTVRDELHGSFYGDSAGFLSLEIYRVRDTDVVE